MIANIMSLKGAPVVRTVHWAAGVVLLLSLSERGQVALSFRLCLKR